jgi:hypothetical protein
MSVSTFVATAYVSRTEDVVRVIGSPGEPGVGWFILGLIGFD